MQTDQPFSFQNVQSLLTPNDTSVTVLGNGALTIDFGVESAAWIEFDSPDLGDVSSVCSCVSIKWAPCSHSFLLFAIGGCDHVSE